MLIEKIAFRGFTCFEKEWVDFSELKPINVIIGRNNPGKSHLLDFVEGLCGENPLSIVNNYRCEGILHPSDLTRLLRHEQATLTFPGLRRLNIDLFAEHHGNKKVIWEKDGSSFTFNKEIFAPHHFTNRHFRRLRADRDIVPEPESERAAKLEENGQGATQIIRDYRVGRKTPQKMNLALQACQYMTLENMSGRFELAEKMNEIVKKIREWNR